MRSLLATCLCLVPASLVHAAVIGSCEPQSDELKLANKCYAGRMDVGKTDFIYLGQVQNTSGDNLCQNALVGTALKRPYSLIQVVKEDGGPVRIHNYKVPSGPKAQEAVVALAGLPSKCIDRAKIDRPCTSSDALKLTYSGTPGDKISIDEVAPRFKAGSEKVLKEDNLDQDSKALAVTLTKDIDRRINLALKAVVDESKTSKRKDISALTDRKQQALECYEMTREFRAKKDLAKADAVEDEERRKLLAEADKIPGAARPAGAPGTSGSGAAR